MTTAPRFYEEGLGLLKEHSEKFFSLNILKEDGTSEADNIARALTALARRNDPASKQQKSELEARLDVPPIPEEYEYAWACFSDLQMTRGSNGFSANPISFLEIDAYIRLSGRVLLPHEIRAIKLIDSAYLSAQDKITRAARNVKESAKKSDATPTPKRVSRRG